jgi:hypothetical protein
MRSSGTQTRVPEVPADQLRQDRTLKQLRKLRWIGKEMDAQKLLQVSDRNVAVITAVGASEATRSDSFPGTRAFELIKSRTP